MTSLEDAPAAAGQAPHPALEAHRVLGDGRTMALLRDDAEIDWWCAPLPHDDPLLWSLLDPGGGSAHFVGLAGPVRASGAPSAVSARPVAGPVLGTVLVTDDGLVEVQDALLPAAGGSALVRVVRPLEGRARLTHHLRVGGFGTGAPSWSGPDIEVGATPWRLHTIGGLTTVLGADATTTFELGSTPVALVLTADPTFDVRLDNLLARLVASAPPAPAPAHRAAVTRAPTLQSRSDDALAVLRACTYAPTGAVVAAPTTSLPEVVGANRQFDYRFSWLRDGSLAAAVAAVVGESDAASDYLGFLEALGPERLLHAPLWTVEGELPPEEREVPGVAGWGGSHPVRVGNAATGQVQYDALGFVAEAVGILVREGGELTDERWELVAAVAERSASGDQRPTSGIWEMREARPLVAADIGRWMALDHACRLGDRCNREVPRHWTVAHERARQRVRRAVRADGLLPQVYGHHGDGADRADASSLLAVICGLIAPEDPAATAVIDACLERLGTGPFLHRYPPDATDGFEGREGVFVPASFWAVTALATVGRVDEAQARLEALEAALPRLIAEELDPELGHGLGNVPLVWSHIELVRSLYALTTATAS